MPPDGCLVAGAVCQIKAFTRSGFLSCLDPVHLRNHVSGREMLDRLALKLPGDHVAR